MFTSPLGLQHYSPHPQVHSKLFNVACRKVSQLFNVVCCKVHATLKSWEFLRLKFYSFCLVFGVCNENVTFYFDDHYLYAAFLFGDHYLHVYKLIHNSYHIGVVAFSNASSFLLFNCLHRFWIQYLLQRCSLSLSQRPAQPTPTLTPLTSSQPHTSPTSPRPLISTTNQNHPSLLPPNSSPGTPRMSNETAPLI